MGVQPDKMDSVGNPEDFNACPWCGRACLEYFVFLYSLPHNCLDGSVVCAECAALRFEYVALRRAGASPLAALIGIGRDVEVGPSDSGSED